MPTAPRVDAKSGPTASLTLGTCTTIASLTTLAHQIFDGGSPNVNSVLSKLNSLDKAVEKGDVSGAQGHAQTLVDFVQKKADQGKLAATPAQIKAFIGGVLCYAGLSPDTFLIQPTDQPQVLTNSTGQSGVSLQANAVTVPTLVTITVTDPNGPSGLITKLDQYPTFVNITSTSQLKKPAVVAICLGVKVPTSVFNRLRLGHQASAGFEITPVADAGFLNCPTTLTSASRVPSWLKSLASLVLPKVVYARQDELRSGGVGGTAGEFSPFDAVDPELRASGGVGGTAGEFKRSPAPSGGGPLLPRIPAPAASMALLTPGGILNTVSGGVCTSVDATVGTALDPLCRPVMTITTAKGTLLQNVPVSWSVTSGGGVIAPNTVATQACGPTFGSTAATTTDATARAGVCWILGPTGGTNTATGTPQAGGDAPAGVTFLPASTIFTATALKATPVVTIACPATVPYNGADQAPCTASATGIGGESLGSVPVTYGPATPRDVGTYTADASFPGNATYNAASATQKSFQVTFSFADGFEIPSGWVSTGPWNRSTLRDASNLPIGNSAFPTYVDAAPGDASAGKLPAPKTGSYAFWYGSPATGNYIGTQAAGDLPHSGGTSTAPNEGVLVSPVIALPPAAGKSLVLRFDSWWEIESVNPATFDIIYVTVRDEVTGILTNIDALGPSSDPPSGHAFSTPFTSGGYNAPPAWVQVTLSLDAFRGRSVRLIFAFSTQDEKYNGFRGVLVDDVRLSVESSASFARKGTSSLAPSGPMKESSPASGLSPLPAPRPRPQP